MTTPMSDESLMLLYRAGDLGAFRELYRRHHRGLYSFISWRCPRKDWVDDIMQDSWANLHQARARYQPQASFRTYLFQIARNRLIDLLRQHRMILATELKTPADADEDDLQFQSMADALCDTPAPDAVLARRQEHEALHAAIRNLPNEQREALVLQQFNDMSLEEISILVAAPVETVKSRLRYAMKKLRQQLEGGSRQETQA